MVRQVDRTLTDDERRAYRQRVEQNRREADAERARVAEEAQAKVAEHWAMAGLVNGNHPYVIAKRIKPIGAKQLGQQILVPLRDADGVLHSLQYITPDGNKRFKSGGRIAGCYTTVSNGVKPDANTPLLICEGWATACSLFNATSYPTAAAMSAGNLLAVARALRAKLPRVPMVICGDDDRLTDGNPGLAKSEEAARVVGAALAIPSFGEHQE